MGFPCVLDTTGCEGWPPLSAHLLHVSGRLASVSSVCRTVRCCWGVLRGCVPSGHCGRTWRQARLRVLGARPMRCTGALWRLLKFACTRAGRAARVSASVRTAGCRQLPSASAQIRWRVLIDNTPVVIGSAAGSACLAGPFARPLADPLRGRGGLGGMAVPGVALPPFLCCRRVAGVREVRPPSGGCGKRSLGSYLCPTPWAAKASLHSLGVHRACRAGGRRPRSRVQATGGAVACCAAARCWVVRGVLLGEVCPVGVVVVRCQPRCRWHDGHRPVLWREEAVPGPPRRFFPARSWSGTRAVRVRPCVVPAGPVVGRGSGPWGVTHTSYKGAAEGTEDFVHQGRVLRPGLRLSADGGLQLPTQRQCLDLVDREDGA